VFPFQCGGFVYGPLARRLELRAALSQSPPRGRLATEGGGVERDRPGRWSRSGLRRGMFLGGLLQFGAFVAALAGEIQLGVLQFVLVERELRLGEFELSGGLIAGGRVFG